jgi:hypothetical protein
MAKKNSKKYADPVTGTYVEPVTDAPYDKSDFTQASLVDDLMPKAVEESLARPTSIVDEANEAINKDYPWAVPSMTAFNRALLVELYRIRKALETK